MNIMETLTTWLVAKQTKIEIYIPEELHSPSTILTMSATELSLYKQLREHDNRGPFVLHGSEGITMTTLEIAEITGKEHKNVLRDVRRKLKVLDASKDGLITEPTSRGASICGSIESTYIDSMGRSKVMLTLSATLARTILSGYSVLHAYKICTKLAELELKEHMFYQRGSELSDLDILDELATRLLHKRSSRLGGTDFETKFDEIAKRINL